VLEPAWQAFLHEVSFEGATFAEGVPDEVVPFLARGDEGL
jgi:hypothetical protein